MEKVMIKVETETRKNLMKLKYVLGLKTMDQVIQYFIRNHQYQKLMDEVENEA